MADTWRAYLQMASGLGEITAARAREVVQGLLSAAPTPSAAPGLAGSVTAVAEDLLASARANRGLIVEVVRTEVERSVAGLGLASPADVTALRARVAELEQHVQRLEADLGAAAAKRTPSGAAAAEAAAERTTATKATAKRASATKATAKKTSARKATAKKPPAAKATVKKAATKKAAARKATTKKATGSSGSVA